MQAGALAALGQALIPYYTGLIIDYASIDPNPNMFRSTTVHLLAVAFGCAVFTGVRGGLFTVAMVRMNVRLRRRLFHALMAQVGLGEWWVGCGSGGTLPWPTW